MNNAPLQELNQLELLPNADDSEDSTELVFCVENMWTKGNLNPKSSRRQFNSKFNSREQTEGGNRSGLSEASWSEQVYATFTEPVAGEADVNGNAVDADEELGSEEMRFSRRKSWADRMASIIPPPGLPVSDNPADHETFMRAREEYLKESGYYLDPYHLLQILYPETYDMVIRDRIPLYHIMDELFAFCDETRVKKENGNLY